MKQSPGRGKELCTLVASDVRRLYGGRGARAVVRAISNPSIHATVIIRLGQACPRPLSSIVRIIGLATYGVEVQSGVSIGPGLLLPHPTSIIIARGSRIGANAKIHQCVTIGTNVKGGSPDRRRGPDIGDDVLIYPGSVVIGPIAVGSGAVIGANSFVDRDVFVGEVVRGKVPRRGTA